MPRLLYTTGLGIPVRQIAGGLLLAVLSAGCGRRWAPPYTPSEALKTFRIEPGFRIELFAAEPLISDPVAMEIDENGRIYVVENHGYPLDTNSLGRVILLQDTNGDGKPDRSTVFADKLLLPTGVMRWKKGLLVTDAPHLWYLEDTNGDGKADVRRAVLSGFAFTNPQHTVNHPVYGLDNWIYLAHEGFAGALIFADKFGDRGSDIHFADRPGGPSVKNERRNVRFRPDTYDLDTTSSTSQFGLAFDEWGRLFTHNNANHARHEVIAARYLRRNPDLLLPSAMQEVSDHGSAATVFPITINPRFEMLTESWEFTSACGLTRYLGGAFPSPYERASFIAEPTHNLVHADLWSPSGASFVASRLRQGVEFLASTDAWFRPVNFYVGPDGALYVMDYYRRAIEHPEWMSRQAYENTQELYDGNTLGRIWRITPSSGLPFAPRLRPASDQELVEYLGHPNIWWRRTAQRLLVDRRSEAARPALLRMLEARRSPLARLHALWTLEGLGLLEAAHIEKALQDPVAGVRENAILLAESRLPALREKLREMERDPDARVRFQLLATLGDARLPAQDLEDRWMQVAALSASSERALALLESLPAGQATEGRAGFLRLAASVIGARARPAEVQRLLARAAREADWWRAPVLEGLGTAFRARRGRWPGGGQNVLLRLYGSSSAAVRRAALRLLEVAGVPAGHAAVARAASTAEDLQADQELRADAVGLLALAGGTSHQALFRKLIEANQPEPVQAAAARALGKVPGEQVGTFLLERWRAMTPAVRNDAADAIFLEPARVRLLLDALEKDQVQPWTLQFRHRRQIIMNRDPAIRDRGRPLVEAKAGERQKILERYRAALEKEGDPQRGRQVYDRVCSKCHRLNGAGSEVGPDLATVRNRTPDALLADILLPSQSIAQTYEAYVVETVSGASLDGVLAAQTPTTITLRQEEAKQEVIPRSGIKRMYASNLSSMPEDLDKQVTVDQMADLLRYLKTAQ